MARVEMEHVRQRVAVSEGLALGMVLNGRWAVPFDTLGIHTAVAAAYRDWARAHAYPQVQAELRSGLSGVHALTRATESASTFTLYWHHAPDGDLRIRSWFEDWTPTRAEDVDYAVEVIAGDVSREEWAALAADVLRRMGA
jgi:hypothetical protein